MNNITIVLNSSNYDTATKSFRYRLKNAQQFQHKNNLKSCEHVPRRCGLLQ